MFLRTEAWAVGSRYRDRLCFLRSQMELGLSFTRAFFQLLTFPSERLSRSVLCYLRQASVSGTITDCNCMSYAFPATLMRMTRCHGSKGVNPPLGGTCQIAYTEKGQPVHSTFERGGSFSVLFRLAALSSYKVKQPPYNGTSDTVDLS